MRRYPNMLGAEDEVVELTTRLGDIARRVDVLESQRSSIVKGLESGAGLWKTAAYQASQTERLQALELELATIYEEAGLLTEQLQTAQGGEAISAEDLVALRDEAAQREWDTIAQKSGLTVEQIAEMKSWGGSRAPVALTPAGGMNMKTMLIVGAAAVAGFFLLNK